MDAVEDVFAKHGVTPATASRGARKPPAQPSLSEPAASAPLDYKSLKVGDFIEVKGKTGTGYNEVKQDGVYEVARLDLSDSRLPIAVNLPGGDRAWVQPESIVRRVSQVEIGASSGSTPTSSGLVLPVRGEFLIHVDVETILANREKGEHKPVTVTRRLSDLGTPHVARELAWNGPSRFVHHEFMKIEGTKIQNWIETDVPVTCWRDGQGIEVMAPKPGVTAGPMTLPILGGFVIHVAAPVLMKNRAEGRNDPVIAVRRAHNDWATDVIFARKVEWSGPTRMVHRPTTPVPGTNGRGVSFVETDADLTLYVDGAEPMVLRMPRRAAA
ncbi:hypothetical protein [uncultured Methylobacterium sp.]|jgi:hypothetical protein|uniref:hypothetical protein n=1 Tax=uncultured Methylobacterium sp. TaxID=157278 RepID=UPI00261B23F5|nr:hypothetical protein [uncultured Methylobacterium sp.]